MTRKQMKRIVAGCALGVLAVGWAMPAAAEEVVPAAGVLKLAVSCPPFKGDPALASVYHGEIVKMLKAMDGIEYLEGSHSLTRRAPEFTYRLNGTIVKNEDGQPFVVVTLTDNARKEQIASLTAPASLEPANLASWKKMIQADMERRSLKLPFECRLRHQQGQDSVSLDRGLDSGLQPGMVLYVSADEELLLSPATGVVIGRDSPRAVGQIEVFRVMENNAYARPVQDTKLPRGTKLFARTF